VLYFGVGLAFVIDLFSFGFYYWILFLEF
jgi:hypothetical protein